MILELDGEESRKLTTHLNGLLLENGDTLTLSFEITELSTIRLKEAEIALGISVSDSIKTGEQVG